MEALESVSWQTVAATSLLASGAPLLIAGLWREWDGLRRPLRDPAKVLTWVRVDDRPGARGQRRRLAPRSDLARRALAGNRRRGDARVLDHRFRANSRPRSAPYGRARLRIAT